MWKCICPLCGFLCIDDIQVRDQWDLNEMYCNFSLFKSFKRVDLTWNDIPQFFKCKKRTNPKRSPKRFYFVLGLDNRTIKRDASLGDLKKIECSSIKIKSKERHKITSQTLGHSLSSHVSREFRPPEVPTFGAGSPGACWLSRSLLGVPAEIGSSGCRKSRLHPEVPTLHDLAACAASDGSREFPMPWDL